MKKLSYVFILMIVTTALFSQELKLGANEVDFFLAKRYNVDQHKLLLSVNGAIRPETEISQTIETTDNKKQVKIYLDIPLSPDYLGTAKLRMVKIENQSDDIATPMNFRITAPKPDIKQLFIAGHSISPDNIINWDHISRSIKLKMTGRDFFIGTDGKIVLEDPFLSISELVSYSTQRIEFTVNINPDANPGYKTLIMENHGGESDTLIFDLRSTATPAIDHSQPRPTLFAGVAQRISVNIRSPQNVAELFIAEDQSGNSRIEDAFFIIEKNVDIANRKLPLKIYILDRSYVGKSLFAVTKNVNTVPIRIGTLSNLVNIKEKYLKFKPIKKYLGEYLDAIYLDETNVQNIRLSSTVDYSLMSPDNRSYPARYEAGIRALKFEEPPKLELRHQGNWRLSTRDATYAGPVWVRKIPKITSIKWISDNPRLRALSAGEPFATGQQQIYRVVMDIRDLPLIRFPTESFEFFEGLGKIVSEPQKTYTDGVTDRIEFDLELSADLKPREYAIIYKPITSKILNVTFKAYNRPIPNNDPGFIILSNLDGSTSRLHLKSPREYHIEFPAIHHPILLKINTENSAAGKQYLHVEAKLFNDSGKQLGRTFTGQLRTDKPELRIAFRRRTATGFVQFREWDSIQLQIEHIPEKYSPPVSAEEIADWRDRYTWEHLIVFRGKKLKPIIDVVTPLQQSVYIYEEDSLRASLFNVGVNVLWYVRSEHNYQDFWPISFGMGTFTSHLDRLADSQSGSIGLAALVNFDIKMIQVAFGLGRTFEYYFKDMESRTKGWHDYKTLVLQLRMPQD